MSVGTHSHGLALLFLAVPIAAIFPGRWTFRHEQIMMDGINRSDALEHQMTVIGLRWRFRDGHRPGETHQ